VQRYPFRVVFHRNQLLNGRCRRRGRTLAGPVERFRPYRRQSHATSRGADVLVAGSAMFPRSRWAPDACRRPTGWRL